VKKDSSGQLHYSPSDLVRYLEDGQIEFVGRFDHQVKVRGFRIELGEIESVLEKHQAVRQAAVVLQQGSHDDKRLVAFVATTPDLSITSDELRDFLRKNLPEYMIPSAIVMLEVLPLMPNGKVDRHALVALSAKQKIESAVFVAPRTPIEEVLTKTWGDVLGIEAPGIHDNFFDLGGHSLMAAQVRSRLREGFEMDLPLRLFFESPSVAQLATAIERLGAAEKKNVGRIAQLWLEVDRLSPEEIEETLQRER
jgi:acyl carrier protein